MSDMSIKNLLYGVKRYIESQEVNMDGEYGRGRSVEELIADGAMPDLWYEVRAAINELESHDMTDDIIRMAQEAGAIPSGDPREWDVWLFQDPAMERFAALVAAKAVAGEREACAKVCKQEAEYFGYLADHGGVGRYDWKEQGAMDCVAAIRARGET